MTERDEIALKIISDEINRRQAELINLEATYRRMGGIFDGDEVPATIQKLLTGPKSKPAKKKKGKRKAAPPPIANKPSITINGKSIEMKKSQANTVEIMLAGAGHVFSKADVAEMAGKNVANPTSFFTQINRRLEPAQVHIVNVPRQGWKLEKIA